MHGASRLRSSALRRRACASAHRLKPLSMFPKKPLPLDLAYLLISVWKRLSSLTPSKSGSSLIC